MKLKIKTGTEEKKIIKKNLLWVEIITEQGRFRITQHLSKKRTLLIAPDGFLKIIPNHKSQIIIWSGCQIDDVIT